MALVKTFWLVVERTGDDLRQRSVIPIANPDHRCIVDNVVMNSLLASPVVVAPGDTVKIKGLAHGEHKFQCCIHPWMRAVVDVE
jgi:hypothetical protein